MGWQVFNIGSLPDRVSGEALIFPRAHSAIGSRVLAAVILQWPVSSLNSESDCAPAAASRRRRITTAYAGAAHKQFALNSESVWSIDLADPEGHGRSTARIP